VITPVHIRWKNFFLYNLFWPHKGERTQQHLITLSDKLIEIANRIDIETMNIQHYIDDLAYIDFSVYLTDSEKNRKVLQNQLGKKNYAIVTQKVDGRVEEFITTIAAKLYFMKKGYLVGDFAIPPEFGIGYGIPDIVGIKGGFVNNLKENGLLINGGDISDLLIWQQLKEKPIKANEPLEIIDCEVKSSKDWNQGFKQLYDNHGYLKSACFNTAYVCFGTLRNVDWQKPDSINEAGSLILTDNVNPLVFHEDPIVSNPSSSRRNNSVQANAIRQSELIDLANKLIARLMISSLTAKKILPNMGDITINQVIKQIQDIRVENVTDIIRENIEH